MGFFKDVDSGKVSNDNSLNTEDMLESLEDVSLDDAFASMEGEMTAEGALASLDSDYLKEMEETAAELSELDSPGEEHELTLEEVMADFPDVVGEETDFSVPSEDEADTVSEAGDEMSDDSISDEDGAQTPGFEFADEDASESASESEEQVIEEAGTIDEEVDDNYSGKVADNAESEMMEDSSMGLETTVISKGTTIRGGISSDCSLEVMGVITGDVECQGKLSIFGTVSGNTSASEIYVETDNKLEGDLVSTGNVNISEKSVVIGTIQAVSAFIAGAVKGDIDADGPVVVDSSAIVYGNITAKSLQLNTGAVVQGICNVGTRDASFSSIFGE